MAHLLPLGNAFLRARSRLLPGLVKVADLPIGENWSTPGGLGGMVGTVGTTRYFELDTIALAEIVSPRYLSNFPKHRPSTGR